MTRVAVVGCGIAGLSAVWQLSQVRNQAPLHVTCFEASSQVGGIIDTIREQGFLVECGPDAWVTQKPWAHELALELGLNAHITVSNDADRRTYILQDGKLIPMPAGMRMMVPGNLEALEGATLFSAAAREAFAAEMMRASQLRANAPQQDESVAAFVRRHFGEEVLRVVAAPLLSGIFGGDVDRLSVRAVMPGFVAMERQSGSLVLAVQSAAREAEPPVFTTLKSGLGSLVDRMLAEVPEGWIRLRSEVRGLERRGSEWFVRTVEKEQPFDAVMLALPVDRARGLMQQVDTQAADLMELEASSAIVVGLGFTKHFELPPGFGFLAPAGEGCDLLACTFMDQKFAGRVPQGGRLLRAFFGGAAAERLIGKSDEELISLALRELRAILGQLPEPSVKVVRRWPRSLPQYHVGHLERMGALDERVAALPGLWLLGNGYRGVGLPDLIRDARAAARALVIGCPR